MTISPHGLHRRSVTPATLWIFGVSASAPMVVLAGGMTSTYAAGVRAVPLSFLLLGAAVGAAMVGMTAMVRDTRPHAATLVALLTHGLGRTIGVAGAAVAVLSYNAIQIGLYGLFGATVATLLGGSWWAWALVGWVLLAIAGVAHLHASTWVVAAVLIAELAVIGCFVAAAFTSPAEPAAFWDPVAPEQLFSAGISTALALGIAAFVGVESVTAFGEETRDRAGIAHAMTAVLVSLTLLYLAASWALAVASGPTRIVGTARTYGTELPITVLQQHYGPAMAGLGWVLVVVSILGAMLAFHHVVARYFYALGREKVLSSRLATIRLGRRTGSGGIPVTGSLGQTLLAAVVLAVAVTAGIDPMTLFVQLSTLAALGVMVLLIGVCISTMHFYHRRRRRGGGEQVSLWQRLLAPALGAAGMTAVLTLTVASLDDTSGTDHARWLLPGVLALAAAAGAARAGWLHHQHPLIWAGIGGGQPRPLAVIDPSLSHLDL